MAAKLQPDLLGSEAPAVDPQLAAIIRARLHALPDQVRGATAWPWRDRLAAILAENAFRHDRQFLPAAEAEALWTESGRAMGCRILVAERKKFLYAALFAKVRSPPMTPSEARRHLLADRPDTGRRYTPKRPWAPMTDAEWAAVEKHLKVVVMGQGRPLRDLRHRIDGMFRIAAAGQPWHTLPEEYGKPDTVSRHFRRLARMGLWMRLLGACADRAAPAPLRAIEHYVVRAARRAMRVLGLDAAMMAERLGMLSAMPVWSPYLTRPTMFFQVRQAILDMLIAYRPRPFELPMPLFKALHRLQGFCAGKPWHRRWAPP